MLLHKIACWNAQLVKPQVHFSSQVFYWSIRMLFRISCWLSCSLLLFSFVSIGAAVCPCQRGHRGHGGGHPEDVPECQRPQTWGEQSSVSALPERHGHDWDVSCWTFWLSSWFSFPHQITCPLNHVPPLLLLFPQSPELPPLPLLCNLIFILPAAP